jgi:hypothetical protein
VDIKDTFVVPPARNAFFMETAHLPGQPFSVFFGLDIPANAYSITISAVADINQLNSKTQTWVIPISGDLRLNLNADTYRYTISINWIDEHEPPEDIPLNWVPPSPNPEVIQLKGVSPVVVLKTVNNDDDRYSAVRAHECVIQFLNEDGSVSLNDFAGAESPDDRWLVEVSRTAPGATTAPANYKMIFTGFLQMDDMSEPLQEPANIIKLTATDKLGTLKDVPLRNFLGGRPVGCFSMITYIAWALAGTGLSLGISTCDRTKTMLAKRIFELRAPSPLASTIYVVGENATDFFKPGSTVEMVFSDFDKAVIVISSSSYNSSTNETAITSNAFFDFYPRHPTVEARIWSDRPFVESSYLDSRSFDKDITEKDSSYTVLENIMSGRYFVTQADGKWWIKNVEETQLPQNVTHNYTARGEFVNTENNALMRNIGRLHERKLINKSAAVTLIRPAKIVNVTYNFNEWIEGLQNENYTEGIYLGIETKPIFGYKLTPKEWEGSGNTFNNVDFRKYNLNGWTLSKINTSTGSLTNPEVSSYIRRYYADSREFAREIVIGAYIENTKDYVLTNNGDVVIEKGDRVTFDMEWRLANILYLNNPTIPVAQIILYGDSGAVYSLGNNLKDKKNKWIQAVNPANPLEYLSVFVRPVIHSIVEWNSIKNDYPDLLDVTVSGGRLTDGAPEGGVLKVRLCHFQTSHGEISGFEGETAQGLFRNIRLDVVRFIDGNSEFKGQYNRLTQSLNFTKRQDTDINIDNSPKRSFRGALLVREGDANVGYGFAEAKDFSNNAGETGSWGKLIAYEQSRQYMQIGRRITAELMLENVAKPSLADVYNVEPESESEHVQGIQYMPLSYEWDTEKGTVNNMTLASCGGGAAVDTGRLNFETGFNY